MRFAVAVRKLNVTDGQTDGQTDRDRPDGGGGGIAIYPVPGLPRRAAGDNNKTYIQQIRW